MFMLIDFRFLFRYNSVNDWLNFPSGPCSQNGGLSVGGSMKGRGRLGGKVLSVGTERRKVDPESILLGTELEN